MQIAIIDDEPKIRRALRRMVEELNADGSFAVALEASTGEECLELATRHRVDILFLDIVLPGPSGLDVLDELRRRGWEGQAVMVSGHNDFEYVKQALRHEAVDYILKPFDRSEIELALNKAKERLAQQRHERLSAQQLSRMKHESDFRDLLEAKLKLYEGQPLSPEELARFPLLQAADEFRLHLLLLPDYQELLKQRFQMDRRLLSYALEMFIQDALTRSRVRDAVLSGRSGKYEWCYYLISPPDADALPVSAVTQALAEIFRVDSLVVECAEAARRDELSSALQRLEQLALYADMASLRRDGSIRLSVNAAPPGIPGAISDMLSDFIKKVRHMSKFGLLHRVAPEVDSLFETLHRHKQVSVMALYQAWTGLHHDTLPDSIDNVAQMAAQFGWDADRAKALLLRELEKRTSAARAA